MLLFNQSCVCLSRILQATGLSAHPGVLQEVQELQESCCSPHLLGFLVDFYEDALETNNVYKTDTLNKALEVTKKELFKNFSKYHIYKTCTFYRIDLLKLGFF